MRAFLRVLFICMLGAVSLPGCALLRYGDFFLPSVRLDHANNAALPEGDAPGAAEAVESFLAMEPAERAVYPTAYHVYVDTPAAGAMAGDHLIGLAFSGGGTRGTLFAACVLEALWEQGDVLVAGPQGRQAMDLWSEVDYVAGVSTGAIPAAAYALNFGDTCPERLRFSQWPECFNVNLISAALHGLVIRPDRLVRDMTVGMNTRPGLASTIAATFFEGSVHDVGSGLSFGDLPAQPVLLLGSTVIQDPGTEFVQTRLPYRFAVHEPSDIPWAVGVQSFESFHTDPMPYGLGEACYNSISFPGNMRSGLLRIQPERAWIYAGLEGTTQARMEEARRQTGYEGVYSLKDGGLIDNRGLLPLVRLFKESSSALSRRPLLIALDAAYRDLRAPEAGDGVISKGWFQELYGSIRAGWQSGQAAYTSLFAEYEDQGLFDLVYFRFTAFARYLDEPESEGYHVLTRLCSQSPGVDTPERLLSVLRGIGTNIDALSPGELAGVRVAARFAVWDAADEILQWAAPDGGKAHWERGSHLE